VTAPIYRMGARLAKGLSASLPFGAELGFHRTMEARTVELGFERTLGAGAERRRLDVDFVPHALIALRRLGNADGNIHVTRFGAALVLHPAAERLHRRAPLLG